MPPNRRRTRFSNLNRRLTRRTRSLGGPPFTCRSRTPIQAPQGYFIKANTHSGLYYTPESVLYENTLPEVWFASEDVAQANGFVRAPE